MGTPTRASSRRSIRLKEWRPSQDALLRPPADYLAASDGSLPDLEYRLRTDANGFIVAPDGQLPFDESLVFLGDSLVESVYVPEEQRFPAAVEALLRAAGRSTRCLNGGYSGATTLHLLLTILGKVGRAERTSVILVVPSNDATALVKAGGYWCMDDARYAPIVPVPEGAKAASQAFGDVDLTTVLNLFFDACRRLRLTLTFATFPHRTAAFDADTWLQRRFLTAANYSRVQTMRNKVNDRVRAVAHRLGVPLIDLDAELSTQTQLFYDDLHLNLAGSARAAALFAEAVCARRAAIAAGPPRS